MANQGGTNIAAALRLAAEQNELLLSQPLERRVRLRSVVLLLSDGEHNATEAVEPVAERLKKDADLVTVAFGDSADEKLLKEIASSEQHFFRCKDGRELRMFLAQVGKTLPNISYNFSRNSWLAKTNIRLLPPSRPSRRWSGLLWIGGACGERILLPDGSRCEEVGEHREPRPRTPRKSGQCICRPGWFGNPYATC